MPGPAAPQIRGEKLVAKVLEAAVEELAVKGYAAASIEDISERAGVAKTTIYRRWPTKAELAVAALERAAADVIVPQDTGTLRGDLTSILKTFRDFIMTPRGGSLMRMMMAEGAAGEIAEVARTIRKKNECIPQDFITRGIKRGELPRGTDPTILLDLLFGAVQHYVFFVDQQCDDRRIEKLLDVVLIGAQSGGARPLKRAK